MKKELTKNNITVTVEEKKTTVEIDGKVVGSGFMPIKTTNGNIVVGLVNFANHMDLGEEVVKAWKEIQEYRMSHDPKEREAAQRIINQVKARGEENLLTEEKEKQWRKVYNNMVNEGGTGVVPQRATVENYEQAKRILGL